LQTIFLSLLLATCTLYGQEEVNQIHKESRTARPICFFHPPDNWSVANPSALSPLVKVGFFGPSQHNFCPSINLAEEKVDCTLQTYLEAVKKIHTTNRHKDWSYLGTFKTLAGEGALTQIDLPCPAGPMRMLQLILLKGDIAYILTGATLKEEFVEHLPLFRKAFRSLELTHNLYSVIQDEKRRSCAEQLYMAVESAVANQKAFFPEMPEWQTFQGSMIEQFADFGAYWQALFIADAFKQLQALACQSLETRNAEPVPIALQESFQDVLPAVLSYATPFLQLDGRANREASYANLEYCLAQVQSCLAAIEMIGRN